MDDFEELLDEPAEPQTAFEKLTARIEDVRQWRRDGRTIAEIAKEIGVTAGRLSQLRQKHPALAEAFNTPADHPEVERPPERELDTGKPIGHADTLAWIEQRVTNGMGPEAIGVLLGLEGAAEFERACKERPEVARAVKRGRAMREKIASDNLAAILADRRNKECLKASQFSLRTTGPHWAPAATAQKEAPKQAVEEEVLLTPAEIMSRLRGPE